VEPATVPEGQKGSAAKPEDRKRGRPKKAENEGKAEAKPAGKRQKSLFDFGHVFAKIEAVKS